MIAAAAFVAAAAGENLGILRELMRLSVAAAVASAGSTVIPPLDLDATPGHPPSEHLAAAADDQNEYHLRQPQAAAAQVADADPVPEAAAPERSSCLET